MSEATYDNLQNADGQDQMEQLDGVTIISQSVLEEIDNSNAEESEDDSIKKTRNSVLDYDAMSMEALTDELEKLVDNEKK